MEKLCQVMRKCVVICSILINFKGLECTFVHLYITVNLALIYNYCSGKSFKSNSVYHDSYVLKKAS